MKSAKSQITLFIFGALFAGFVISACNSNPPVIAAKTVAGTLPTFTFTPTPTFTLTPCMTPSSVFGDSTIEGASTNNSGSIQANKYIFPGGAIKGLSLYTSGAGQFSMALYFDNGSGTAPGNLVVQSASVATVASPGWNTAYVTPQVLPAGTYWLAFQTDTIISTYFTFNGTTPMPLITQSFGVFPATYAGYSTCACSVISMRADYCP